MGFTLYPAYSPPIHDVKINSLWHKAFNVNGRIYGFDITDNGSSITIDDGAFISNGCVVKFDSSVFSLESAPDEPYYLYGYFGSHLTQHTAVMGFSPGLENGYAPLAKREHGVWTLSEAIHFDDLRLTVYDHTASDDMHLSEDEYDAIVNATNPHTGNLFLRESDLLMDARIIRGELALSSLALSVSSDIFTDYPIDSTSLIRSDCINIAPDGVYELIDIESTTARRGIGCYVEDITKTPIASIDSTEISFGRCVGELTDELSAPNDSQSMRLVFSNGHRDAHVSWSFDPALDLSLDSDHYYINFKAPTDDNLISVKFEMFDGTNYSSVKRFPTDIDIGKWDAMELDISSLSKSSISNAVLSFNYADSVSSGDYYIGSIFATSYVQTRNISDSTEAPTSVSASVLSMNHENAIAPIVDFSLDGTSFLTNMADSEEIYTSGVIEPLSFKLRFHLLNSGGDYSQVKTQWESLRRNFSMCSDGNVAVIAGGEVAGLPNADVSIYRKLTDSMSSVAGMSLQVSAAGSARIDDILYINGGLSGGSIPLNSNIGLSWRTKTTRSLQNLTATKRGHGCAAINDNRLIVWQGINSNSAFEYIAAADSWVTLTNSSFSGRSCGGLVGDAIYAGRGSSANNTGAKYQSSSRVWTSLSLNGFAYYSTCATLKSRAIIYESETSSIDNRFYLNPDTLTEKSIQCPLTGAGTSGTAVYPDDSVSFGPWEYGSVYDKTHYLYTPYKTSFFHGFSARVKP